MWSCQQEHSSKGRNRMSYSSLVYSTETGVTCPECEKSIDQCSCNPSRNPEDGSKTVRVSSTNKGRKGKTVTIIKGLVWLKEIMRFDEWHKDLN